jgi:MFS family permease
MDNGEPARLTTDQWIILGSLMVGVFMGALDIAIVSPAIGVITEALSIGPRQVSWLVTAYLLMYVVSTPLMAALADRYGRKVVFVSNLAVFGIGSLWAALSRSLFSLLVARAIQALGAGGLFPIAGTLVGEIFPRERRGLALGFVGIVWGLAVIVGPLAGGWLTQGFGWPAIFWVNVPISVLAVIYAGLRLPRDRGVHEERLDVPGMILLGLGLASLAYGLNQIHTGHLLGSLGSLNVWPFLVGAVLLLVLFVLVERQLVIGLTLSFVGGVAEAGIVYLPYYVMDALGLSVGKAGTLVLAAAGTFLILTAPVGRLVDRIGAKPALVAGTALTAVGTFLLTTTQDLIGFVGYQIVLGMGLSSLLGTPARYVVLAETNDAERSSAQSLMGLETSFGTMFGSPLAGAFLASHPGSLRGFHEIYLMVAAVSLIGMGLSLALRWRRPGERRKAHLSDEGSGEERRG